MKKDGFEIVESEIRREKAEALGRAGERLGRALQEVEAFRRRFLDAILAVQESDHDGSETVSALAERSLVEYARLCEGARALRHALIVQREAVGLWRHEDVERQYPSPGPLTLPKGTGGPENSRTPS
jgi:hypothetical protein